MDWLDRWNRTPLHWAIFHGHADVCEAVRSEDRKYVRMFDADRLWWQLEREPLAHWESTPAVFSLLRRLVEIYHTGCCLA